ncbi:MAG: hypothetical protein WDN45_17195 [Caulobacteraceae bacterium]
MDQLEAFLKRYGRNRNARHWLGPRPDVRAKVLPRAIASMVGYPTTEKGETDELRLQQIERSKAAQVLAWVATESQAYGRRVPRESHRKEAEAALKEFGDSAVFFTNFKDLSPSARSFSTKLSDATFDAGLIAYDDRSALIFWAEDED